MGLLLVHNPYSSGDERSEELFVFGAQRRTLPRRGKPPEGALSNLIINNKICAPLFLVVAAGRAGRAQRGLFVFGAQRRTLPRRGKPPDFDIAIIN